MARLAAVDPAAVAAVATRAGTARSAVASRPAASAPAASAPTAGPTPSAPGPTSAERGDSAEDDRSRDRADDRTDGGPGSGLSAAPASPPPSTGGRVADRLPSEIIDTGDWYLTLPTGREGRPDLVEGSAFARYHSQFFQLNQAKNGVVFTAGTDGATTSGSQYPRSELREMFGSEKASWDGRKGRHTMEIVEAITETPEGEAGRHRRADPRHQRRPDADPPERPAVAGEVRRREEVRRPGPELPARHGVRGQASSHPVGG